MTQINLYDWDIEYKVFANWVKDTNAAVHGVVAPMSQALYEFEKEEDYLAFTLKFSKKKPGIDAGYFYCPYIPLQIYTPKQNAIKTNQCS